MTTARAWPGIVLAAVAAPAVLLLACRTPGPHGGPVDPHAHDRLFAVLWMREAAEFEAACRQAFAAATRTLEAAVHDRTIVALPDVAGAGAPPAVIADLDETILDNGPYQARLVADGVEFDERTWSQWVESQGRHADRGGHLLPGAEAFLRRAAELGVARYYVSNRTDGEHVEATLAVLAAADPALSHERHRLLLRPQRGPGDKEARRAMVAARHRVVLLLGDDLADFVSVPSVAAAGPIDDQLAVRRRLVAQAAAKWGTTWILLPNPSYGSWARVYAGADAGESHRLRLERLRPAASHAVPAAR